MWFKKRIYSQIDDYHAWRTRMSFISANNHREYLLKYARFSGVEDVTEITEESIEAFRDHIMSSHTFYSSLAAAKALRGFLRFYKSKGYPCMKPHMVMN